MYYACIPPVGLPPTTTPIPPSRSSQEHPADASGTLQRVPTSHRSPSCFKSMKWKCLDSKEPSVLPLPTPFPSSPSSLTPHLSFLLRPSLRPESLSLVILVSVCLLALMGLIHFSSTSWKYMGIKPILCKQLAFATLRPGVHPHMPEIGERFGQSEGMF